MDFQMVRLAYSIYQLGYITGNMSSYTTIYVAIVYYCIATH